MADIEISNAQDFIDFCNGDKGTGSTTDKLQVTLTGDIDLAELGDSYVGMPTAINCDIEGNGHTVKNAVALRTGTLYILRIGSNSTVKNIAFENMHLTATSSFYFISGGNYLYNIRWKGDNRVLCNSSAYLIQPSANSETNCVGFSGYLETGSILGSIYGFYSTSSNVVFKNCYLSGALVTPTNSSQQVRMFNGSTLYNCDANSVITCAAYTFCSSGLISDSYDACQVTATTVNPGAYANRSAAPFPHAVYFVTDYYPDFVVANPEYAEDNGVTLKEINDPERMRELEWAVVIDER